MKVRRLFDILDYYLENKPNQEVALAGKLIKNGESIAFKSREYCNNLSFAMIKLGVQSGDKVAIISTNRPEWNMLDMAIMQIGAITVPVYPTISESDYQYILNHCEAKVAFIEGLEVMTKIEHILPVTPNLKHVYTFINRERLPYLAQLIMGEQI